MPGPEAPRGDLVVVVEPQLVRRHVPGRVLLEERGQRVHVVATRRPRRSVRAERHGPRPSVRSGASSTSSSLSVARARWSALLTDATVVSSSSATSLACQRRTSRRMRTARWRGGRCWSAAMKASRIDSRATAVSAGSAAVGTTMPSGTGSIQADSTSGGRSALLGRAGRAEVHRPRASLAAAEHVEADVRRDPVQPRAQLRAALEPVVGAPGADHRLLDRILRLEGGAEHPVGVAGELGAMAFQRRGQVGSAGWRRRSSSSCYRTPVDIGMPPSWTSDHGARTCHRRSGIPSRPRSSLRSRSRRRARRAGRCRRTTWARSTGASSTATVRRRNSEPGSSDGS